MLRNGCREKLVKRLDVGCGLLFIEFQDLATNRPTQIGRVSRRAYDQRHVRKSLLRVGFISLHRRHLIQTILFHVTDDADDLEPFGIFVPTVKRDSFADGIFVRKNLRRHRLVDQSNARRIFCVSLSKYAAPAQRNAHRLEIFGAHRVIVRALGSLRRKGRPAIYLEGQHEVIATQWNHMARASCLNTGQGPCSFNQLLEEGDLLILLRVLSFRQ